LKIILGTFKDNGDELAEFLGPRLGAEPEVSGGEINFEDDKVKKTIRSRHVKTYVKRFLNKKGERANYQVQVAGKELRLIELEREEEEEEKEEKKEAPRLEEKAAERGAEEIPAKDEAPEVPAEGGAEKAEEEADAEKEVDEKKEGSLDEAAVKKQTKPKRKKTD
jgi:hypothetical protein